MRRQPKNKDALKQEKMGEKIIQVRKRGYIAAGCVISGTHYFCVDKGVDDIQMV